MPIVGFGRQTRDSFALAFAVMELAAFFLPSGGIGVQK